MCKHIVNTVQHSVNNSSMPWPWCQKSQANGIPGFGVTRSLAAHPRFRNIQQSHSETGKTSPLLRLDSVGEISSDTEPNSAIGTSQDLNRGAMENSKKYPYTHAADDQLHQFRYGNQFQQAYKMGFQPQTQAFMMPQAQRFANPVWEATPQMYGQPAFGFGGQVVGSAVNNWACYNNLQHQQYPSSFSYSLMGCVQPVYQEVTEVFPAWTEIAHQQAASNHTYPKSQMNPNAKPFTPLAMRHQPAKGNHQPAYAMSAEEPLALDRKPVKTTDVLSDKAESGPDMKDVKKGAAVVSVPSDAASSEVTQDSGIAHSDDAQSEISTLTSNENGDKYNIDSDEIVSGENCEPIHSESKINATEKSEIQKGMGSSGPSIEIPVQSTSRELSNASVVLSLSSEPSMDVRCQDDKPLGRNLYILSRPRLKKKSKPSLQDRKRRKKRTGCEASTSDSTESCKDEKKRLGMMAFIVGSASSEDDSEDERRVGPGSLLISPLQCDSESGSGGDSDWDEVDDVTSAADFLTDQMCELLQPFMLSVLTVSDSSCLAKSASAPHLTNQFLDAVNRRWSEAYNSSTVDDLKSVGAKNKKQVHFAQDEGDTHPLQTVHQVEEYCRRGPWERYAADHCRFKSRIADVETVIDPVLRRNHRDKIYSNRFAENVS